jgi:hypothetical protein
MRQDLVDWMSCQHGMLELADETFHLALRYLDTFLLRRGASPGFRVADCFFFLSFSSPRVDAIVRLPSLTRLRPSSSSKPRFL